MNPCVAADVSPRIPEVVEQRMAPTHVGGYGSGFECASELRRSRQPLIRFIHCLALAVMALMAPGKLAGAEPSGRADRAAIFQDEAAGGDAEFAQEVAARVREAGYEVGFIGAATLTNVAQFAAGEWDLLVLPKARSLPADSVTAIDRHLRAGGDLLALGLPMWDSPTFRIQGRWISRAEYDRVLSAQKPQRVIEDFAAADLTRWSRATDNGSNPVRHSLEVADRGRALHVVIDRVAGWETLQSPPLAQPFPPGHTLTCFRAKGDGATRQLSLEWTERDGSRWIAVVDLTPEWRSYGLTPEAFKAWLPPAHRRGAGDRLNVTNAVRFTVGMAFSHTAIESPRQEYWFDDLGTAPNPYGDEAPPTGFEPPRLESLCPGYQFYPVTTRAVVRLSHEKAGLEAWEAQTNVAKLEFEAMWPLLAMHPRPRGVGFNQDRPWRWEPLLGAYDPADKDYRGALGALLVHVKPPYRGSVWAGFTPIEPGFYRQPLVRQAIRQVLERMRRGVFLVEAGPERFTNPVEQPSSGIPPAATGRIPQNVAAGARVVQFGQGVIDDLSGWMGDVAPDAPGWEAMAFEFAGNIRDGMTAHFAISMPPSRERQIGIVLMSGKQVLDAVKAPVLVWNPVKQPPLIEARDGGFWLDGKPWKAQGVNYMPSTGIGLANGNGFEHWLGRGAYDPSAIQRDLERIKKAGLNAVSAFIYHQSLDAGHLFDFLRRCESLGLRVNLSLRPGTPMDFRWAEMKALIEHYRLASNTTVFAYDLAWEPSHFDEAYQRKHYTTDWSAWVLKRHGSVTNAEAAWGHPAPGSAPGADSQSPIANSQASTANRQSPIANSKAPIADRQAPIANRLLVTPPMKWLTQDGPWRKCVADYRRFLDDLLGERYAEARRLVKTIDPVHPVSLRMQFSGDPTFNAEHLLPYDFFGLSKAVDLWEPEAYGRIGDWEKVKPGHFTAAYARLGDPAKPVMWSEMGFSVWDQSRMAPQPGKLALAARYYADFYRMLTESGADGIFFWWYPGGYRLNEQSDYGILNPDGTDRELTKVIRTEGARFLAAPKPTAPDYWIAVDRDHDARGLFGVYEAVKQEYWKAISDGKTPGLKWRAKPGDATRTD
jgi:hypothetical protein